MGDHVSLSDAPPPKAVPPPALPDVLPSRGQLSRVSDYLQDNSRTILTKSRYDKYRRYVTLNTQEIYTSLISLYMPMFTTQWHRFKRFMEAFPPPAGVTPQGYAARIYIAGWLHDLYVSNREAVKKLSPLAYSQHFQQDEVYCSYEYDEFLTLVNAAIRPTNIRGVPEDTLYIPLLAEQIDWLDLDSNFFGLNYYSYDYNCLLGLIGIMKESKSWKISTLVTNTLGRPFWLFDWHTDNKCCSWFPTEGNYNMEDVSLAYIIGVACTPKLGIRDVDDWQPFPGGVVPQNVQPYDLDRAVARRFYGSYEVRTLEQRTTQPTTPVPLPPTAKRRATTRGQVPGQTATPAPAIEPATSAEIEGSDSDRTAVPEYRLTDWVYYNLTIINLDVHTRTGALRMLIFN